VQGVTGDPYAVLGVGRDATDGEIRAAWETRVTAAAKASDLTGAQRVDAAYEVLRHPARRAMYDRTGIVPEQRRPAPDQRFVAPGPPVAFRSWTPAQPRRPNKGSRERIRVLAVALVTVAVAGVLWQMGIFRGSATAAVHSDVWTGSSDASGALPPMHLVSRPHRLLASVQPPAGTGGYVARGARWDPCQPIRYVVSGVPPFAGAAKLLKSAITEVSRTTGLMFVYAGSTSELASERRAPYQPDRYGKRWAPVLVAWTDPSAVERLNGPVVGLGGGDAVTPPGDVARIVSGIVYLDAADLAIMLQRPSGQSDVRAVMLHELGHLVGLQHVNDPTAIMYPAESEAVPNFSSGDLRGLASTGNGPCPTTR
jgi:hypothetical protein